VAQKTVNTAFSRIKADRGMPSSAGAFVQGVLEQGPNVFQADLKYLGATFTGCYQKITWHTGAAIFKHYNDGRWVLATISADDICFPSTDVNIVVGTVPRGGSAAEMTDRLMNAVTSHDLTEARQLLEYGANPDVPKEVGYNTPFMAAAEKNDLPMVTLLLDKGANVNVQGGHGETALMAALRNKSIDAAKLLLNRGANPKIGNEYNITALMIVASLGNVELAKMILAKGVDTQAKNGALAIAVREKQTAMAQFLRSNGAQ